MLRPRQIATTRRRDMLLQQIVSCDAKIFDAAICRTNSNGFEFMQARWVVAATEWPVAVICRIVCLGF